MKKGSLSVRSKLIMMQMITTCLVLLIFSSILIWQEANSRYGEIVDQHSSQATLVGLNCISAIDFFYQEAAEETLRSLQLDEMVLNAWITRKSGDVFATYSRPGHDDYSFDLPESPGHILSDYIFITEEIWQEDLLMGHIHLRLDMTPFRSSMADLLLVSLVLIVLAIALAFALASQMQKMISAPVEKLTSMVRKVANTKDLTVRLESNKHDEFGILSNSMNSMLQEIKDLNESLEFRVKERTEELERERNRFKNITTHLPAMIYEARLNSKSGLEYIYLSPSMRQMYEVSPEEEYNLAEVLFSRIHPEDVAEVRESHQEAISQGKGWHNIHRIITPSGRIKWIEGFSNPVVQPDGSLVWDGLDLDITDRKIAEEKLIQSESRLAEAQRIAHIGNWVWDSEKRKLSVSNEFRKIYEWDDDNLIEAIHPDDREAVLRGLRTCEQTGETQDIHYRILTPEGTLKWIHGIARQRRGKSRKESNLYGTIQDVTEWKEVTDSLEESKAELEAANKKLRDADRIKSIFLASMSHELRTPLNSIIGFTGILLQGMVGDLNEEQKKQLSMVKSSAQHLLELINEVLDISKIEAGQVDLEIETFDFSQTLNETVNTLMTSAVKKGIILDLDVIPEISIRTDRRRIRQIILNLVNNAIKFTSKGSVSVSARLQEKNITIAVEDTGVGIREDDMVRLFQPFQQVDDSMTKKYEGTGLGLYLSKKIITLLGGEIFAESVYGQGSRFTVKIPQHYGE